MWGIEGYWYNEVYIILLIMSINPIRRSALKHPERMMIKITNANHPLSRFIVGSMTWIIWYYLTWPPKWIRLGTGTVYHWAHHTIILIRLRADLQHVHWRRLFRYTSLKSQSMNSCLPILAELMVVGDMPMAT